METIIVPAQVSGKKNDLAESIALSDHAKAKKCFDGIKDDLLHPGVWGVRAGKAGATFELVSDKGEAVMRAAEKGDLLKIDLPGPGTISGDGYDWVRIDEIQSGENLPTGNYLFAMRVSPCNSPSSSNTGTAHFFTAEASSTLLVELSGTTVTLSYHGRNETPNTTAGNVVDKLRNAVTGTLAMAGVSELQWTALLKGLLEHNRH
jgi:hypothetical protein